MYTLYDNYIANDMIKFYHGFHNLTRRIKIFEFKKAVGIDHCYKK